MSLKNNHSVSERINLLNSHKKSIKTISKLNKKNLPLTTFSNCDASAGIIPSMEAFKNPFMRSKQRNKIISQNLDNININAPLFRNSEISIDCGSSYYESYYESYYSSEVSIDSKKTRKALYRNRVQTPRNHGFEASEEESLSE